MITIVDAAERQQALDPARSFIVQAPAGSGKTGLLIQRYLMLLGYVEYPEQILAMTFTRKAAGEMKRRILEALEAGASDVPPVSDHDRATWELARKALQQDGRRKWRLTDNPSRLRIQTIDSFCSGLAAQMPILSEQGGPPAIEENPADIYRETAARALLLVEEQGRIGDAARAVLTHLDNSKSAFIDRIVDMLEKREQWLLPFFEKHKLTEDFKSFLENTLAESIEDRLEKPRSLFPAKASFLIPQFADYAARNIERENPNSPIIRLRGLRTLPLPKIRDLSRWTALAELFLTKDGEYRKRPDKNIGFPADKSGKNMKEEFSNLLVQLADRTDLAEALHKTRKLPSPHFSDMEWDALQAMLTLLPELERLARAVFRERGKTDFAEISLSALKALGKGDDPTDLLLKLDMKLQHILVDEYQDTSFKQYGLLTKLTSGWTPGDGRTLFVVGDPMQSIYRFRDAEVGLFLRTRNEGIGDVRLDALTLKTNFRSQQRIVSWVNGCFAEIFPRQDDPMLGAIQYTASEAALPEEKIPGMVAHPVIDPKSVEEAEVIVKLIGEIRAAHGKAGIAILVRARPHLVEIVHRLQKAGVKFRAEEINPLATRPAIRDLLALLRAIVSPWDRLAWLSILRAPWCGLALGDLHKLCLNDADSPVWTLLNDTKRVAGLSSDGKKRTGRLVAILRDALEARGTANLRELTEGCWIALGGPACIDAAALKDAEVFFDKIGAALEEDDIYKLQNLDRTLNRLYSAPEAGEDDAVHIMTMHKAKGLEFDFVIIPGLGRQKKVDAKRLMLWIPHGDDLLLAPIQEKGGGNFAIYDYLDKLDAEKDDLETLRLLYVSATRAKKQLHLFGHAPVNKEGISTPIASSLLRKLWPYLQRDWRADAETDAANEADTAPQLAEPEMIIRRLPADYPSVLDTSEAVDRSPETPPEYLWAGNDARCLGTVLHAVFKNMATEGLERWSAGKADGCRSALQTALLDAGLPHTRIDAAVSGGIKAIENILSDPTGRWIMQPRAEHKSEFSITGILENQYSNNVIDRTFVDENDVRWVIDYKTGEHMGADLEEFFAEERRRYRPQLERYEMLIRLGGETRRIKKALYYPLHRWLIEL